MAAHIGKLVLGASALAFVGSCAGSLGPANSGPIWQQNWTMAETEAWSYASQGARLMPNSWFAALEQPNSQALFSDLDYLTSFGFLAAPDDWEMTRPIGFAVDNQKDKHLVNTKLRWFKGQGSKEEWIGFNCAACHTAQIDVPTDTGLKSWMVQGAPSMGDFQSFIGDLNAALSKTLQDTARFDRFAVRVLQGKRDTPKNRGMLRESLGQLVNYQNRVAHPNITDSQYGFARVDAIGYIFNKTIVLANPDVEDVQGNQSDAPVSYPFLWHISRENHLQYNGMVPKQQITIKGVENIDVGAVGRNAGEVIGVFGDVTPKSSGITGKLGIPAYRSSVRIENLDLLEASLARLDSPEWTNMVGTVDPLKSARGKELYDQKCASCHIPREQWDNNPDWEKGKGIEVMVPLHTMFGTGDLTDTGMACNAFEAAGHTGEMQGGPGTPNAIAPVSEMLTTMVKGVLIDQAGALLVAGFDNIYYPDRLPVVDGEQPQTAANSNPLANAMPASFMVMPEDHVDHKCINALSKKSTPEEIVYANSYKARPLEGIWATAPYLHNGSVPTLYHLLLAPNDRPKSWWVGGRTLDTKNVGLEWKTGSAPTAFNFKTETASGDPITGNSNQGHNYGASDLSEEDRWALVEYLKTL